MQGRYDAVVIGSGPNGLVAACTLAKAGLSVIVLEANPDRPGGAVGSETATLPGFWHDVGAAFFPWGQLSPAFAALDLQAHGLEWLHGDIDSCHPAPDGSFACISRDLQSCTDMFGSAADGRAFVQLAELYRSIEPKLLAALLEPFPTLAPALRISPVKLAKIAAMFARSGAGLSRSLFASEAARRVLPGLALHVDVGPDDKFGSALGFMLAMTATTGGFAVPRGGAQAISDALCRCLAQYGGKLRLGVKVTKLEVADGELRSLRLHTGEDIPAGKLVLADTDMATLLLDMVGLEHLPGHLVERLQSYPRGFGTFKMDWALSQPVPWSCEAARRSAVVHAGDSLQDLAAFTAQVRAGSLPENPYLVIGQQSLLDPSRAPAGQHTLWAYSRVPSHVAGGWTRVGEGFADRIEARIEALAPGFRDCISARRIVSPDALQAQNPNLVGGDLGGGSNAWNRQLLFRPLFPWFRYRMPAVRGLYLCSSYAHPGAGVHGMCGYNAARVALRSL